MIAICIESSHQRGMGHFYRALNMLDYFAEVNEKAVIFINNDSESVKILKEKDIVYEIVAYDDTESGWEKNLIHKYHIDIWILDKFETSMELAEHVHQEGILLVAIDDKGEGSKLADLHFCGMLFQNIKGKKVYKGKEYIILNSEIKKYRRKRTTLNRILVTLGGSDTYGVTVNVVKILKKQGYSADIVVGPNFRHRELLEQCIDENFTLYNVVPSLIAKFSEYDLAITGGGITCFEANASGIPCIVVANELHEIASGKYLATFGGVKFAGYYKDISEKDIDIAGIDIAEMSEAALRALSLDGMKNVYNKMQEYRERRKNEKVR